MYFALETLDGMIVIKDPIVCQDDGDVFRICNELQDLVASDNFACMGHRNDSAVNFCIWMWCLGYDEDSIMEYAEQICHASHAKWSLWKEHIERVTPYLIEWGDRGTTAAEFYTL